MRKIEEERKALEARQAELKKLSMESQEDNQAEDAMEKPAEKPGKRYAGKSSGKGAEAVTEKKQSGKVSGVEEPVISSMERERSMEVSAEKETSVPKELFADNSAEFPAEDLREELETRENILHSMEHDLKPSQERMDLNKVLQGLDEIAASKERDQQEKKLLEKAEKKAATAAKGSGKGRSLQNSQEDKVIEEVLKEFFA